MHIHYIYHFNKIVSKMHTLQDILQLQNCPDSVLWFTNYIIMTQIQIISYSVWQFCTANFFVTFSLDFLLVSALLSVLGTQPHNLLPLCNLIYYIANYVIWQSSFNLDCRYNVLR